MNENIFEHSFKDQSLLVKKEINSINTYKFKDEKDYINFIMKQMTVIGNVLGEKEEVPSWVIDIYDYRKKSEIVLFLTVFDSINWSSLRNKIPEFNPYEFINSLFSAASKHGEKRGWDYKILYLQFSRIIGNQIFNLLVDEVKPRNIEGEGYN